MAHCFISKTDCSNLASKIIGSTCRIVEFTSTPVSDNNVLGNLGSNVLLTIDVETSNGVNNKLQFFVKTLPQAFEGEEEDEEHKKYAIDCGYECSKEISFYELLLPQLKKYCDIKFCADFFTAKDNCIILENLAADGFSIVPADDALSVEQCKSMLHTMAKFHAASFVLEEKLSASGKPYRLTDNYKYILRETSFSFETGHPRNDWMHVAEKAIVQILKSLPEYHDQIDYIVEQLRCLLHTDAKMYVRPSKTYRNCVSHNDLWKTNVLFRNEDRLECVFVDFQVFNYLPPALEVLTTLYLNTDAEFVQEHLIYLLKKYYDALVNALSMYNVRAETVVTKTDFLKSCNYYNKFARLKAVMFGASAYLSPKHGKDVLEPNFMYEDRSSIVCKAFREDLEYRRRLYGVLTQFIDCLLDQNNEIDIFAM